VEFSELAGLTEGLAGSDIASVCRNAAMMAITDCVNGGGQKTAEELCITAELFKAAIEKVGKRK
jgi:SpoVK/Ycf46/Vps4 family AAA+-type ATPase